MRARDHQALQINYQSHVINLEHTPLHNSIELRIYGSISHRRFVCFAASIFIMYSAEFQSVRILECDPIYRTNRIYETPKNYHHYIRRG